MTEPDTAELDTAELATAELDTGAPLAGVVVADFSRVLAGPLATMTLADLGAEVTKVERPGVGDDTRQWGPPWSSHGSSYFACANRSKRSVTLDLHDVDDRERARQLATSADVLVENFMSGTLDRMGLGYEDLKERNPGLVYCSITGFGSATGASLPGYDFVVQALGGLMSITGAAEGEPTKVGVALVDVLTGKDAVIGILAALRERERSGHGQRVEVNLLSSLLGALANQASAYLTTGVSPGRMGNQHPSIAPYETLHCSDGLIAIACGNDRQFATLARVLGTPELADDDRFRDNSSRVTNRPALVATLERGLALDSVESWTRTLNAVGVAAGPVSDLAGALERADVLGLSPTISVGEGHPDQVRHPVTYSRSRLPDPTPPPALGQHNDHVRHHIRLFQPAQGDPA